ncbi:kinase-like domain-containing protein [Rhizophagus irregularis DAOM 181602=DAOM 197198]|nr:kinase-like domain-containing protein [Rhizophagus irregularis DAOM 181602=DAOM 197198]
MNTDNDPFDTTQKLKSSPVPVLFIPLKDNEDKCNHCGTEYSKSLKYNQKYCKNCLFRYIQNITVNNKYLNVHLSTNNSQCIKHKTTRKDFYTTSIQEWCEYCSEILYFTQVVTRNIYCWHIFNVEHCELCNYRRLSIYQVSSGWVESTLNKKSILILYLPWWDSYSQCIVCYEELKYIYQESKSYCQKWCSHCFIVYNGCRIDITDRNYIIEEFLASIRIDNKNLHLIGNYKNRNTIGYPSGLYSFINKNLRLSLHKKTIKEIEEVKWIPYSQITDLKKIAEGGFSIIYKATWEGIDVAVKKLHDSQNISKYFLNELRSLYQCNDGNEWVIGCYGFTQDPITKEYMLILNYAEGGNLHDYLQKNFINITWNNKLFILRGILIGLESIHKRPKITKDTPECYDDLMKKCWDSNPSKRPTIYEISNSLLYCDAIVEFEQAEKKRLELIQLKKLGPEFSEKSHPKAIYTSRALSNLISKASTIGSMVSFNMKQEYITREYEFDINNIQRSSTQNTNSATQNLIVPVNSSRKRNFEELKDETNENQRNRKYIKVDNSDDELLNIIELI